MSCFSSSHQPTRTQLILKIGVNETLDIELVTDGASPSQNHRSKAATNRNTPPLKPNIGWVSRVRSAGPRIHNHIQTTPII